MKTRLQNADTNINLKSASFSLIIR